DPRTAAELDAERAVGLRALLEEGPTAELVEARVIETVAGDLVPPAQVFADEVGSALRALADQEERRRDPELVQQVEVALGHLVGAVVERQGDPPARRGPLPEHTRHRVIHPVPDHSPYRGPPFVVPTANP